MRWTAARYPNGSWDAGGKASDPSYAGCEVFQVDADCRQNAIRKAQNKRSRDLKKIKDARAQADVPISAEQS